MFFLRKSGVRARSATVGEASAAQGVRNRRATTPARHSCAASERFWASIIARPGERLRVYGFCVSLACSCQPHAEPAPAAGAAAAVSQSSGSRRATAPKSRMGSDVAGAPNAPLREFELLAASTLTWEFRSEWGPLHVVVYLPQRTTRQRFGALVALHGRGESLKGSARGARGWLDDYRVLEAIRRLKSPPLRSEDFGGLVSAEDLAQFNRRLRERPYRDVILVMPYLPDILKKDEAFVNAPKFAELLWSQVLPRVRRELPLRAGVAFAIDGVSLGGRASLLMAFATPDLWVSAGGLQAAIDDKELVRITELAKAATARNPRLKLRILTSDQDYYQSVNRQLSQLWTRASVAHEFRLVQGTHSYEFNRGPGALEMLTFHSRQLND